MNNRDNLIYLFAGAALVIVGIVIARWLLKQKETVVYREIVVPEKTEQITQKIEEPIQIIEQNSGKQEASVYQRPPYNSGIQTIPTATEEGDYPVFVNLFGWRADEGIIKNYGPGTIYMKMSTHIASMSDKEFVIEPEGTYDWSKTFGYRPLYIWMRADEDNTKFQIITN